MAVINNFNNLNQNDGQQDQQNGNANKPVQIGGISAFGGDQSLPAMGSAAPTVQNAPTSSGRFTNLQSYINANRKFNEAGGGLAGKISTDLGKQASDISSGFEQAKQGAKQQVEQGRVAYDPNLVAKATSNPQSLTAEEQSSFQKMRDAAYRGPSDISNIGQFQQQASNLESLTNLAGSERTRPTLLSRLYSTPGYSTGQKSLDNLFLQADPTQLQKLSQVNQLVNPIKSNIQSGIQEIANLGAGSKSEAEQTRANTLKALQDAITGFGNESQQRAESIKQQLEQQYGDVRDVLRGNFASPETLSKLGLSQGMNLYNVDPSQFLQKTDFNPTSTNVLTSDQISKIQALSNLAGGKLEGPASSVISQFSGPLSAYQAPLQAASLNLPALQQAIAQSQGAFNTAYQNMIDQPAVSGGARSIKDASGVNTTGNIVGDIKALQEDIATRKQLQGKPESMGYDQTPQIQQNERALEALQKLIQQYGIGRTLSGGTLNLGNYGY